MVEQPVWEAPPVGTRSGYDWASISDQLRERPGDWMRVYERGPTSIANSIRQGEIRALTPVHRSGRTEFGFEVRTRNNIRGTPRMCSLYLRYVAPDISGMEN